MSSSTAETRFSVTGTRSARTFMTVATASCDLSWLKPVLRRTCSTITAPRPSDGCTSDSGTRLVTLAISNRPPAGLLSDSVAAVTDDESVVMTLNSVRCWCTSDELETLTGGGGAAALWLIFFVPAAAHSKEYTNINNWLRNCYLPSFPKKGLFLIHSPIHRVSGTLCHVMSHPHLLCQFSVAI